MLSAVTRCRRDSRVGLIHARVGVVDLGEFLWHLATQDRGEPVHLLRLELGVVGNDRERRPALRAAILAWRGSGEQDLLFGCRETEQAGDRALQLPQIGHAAASSSLPQPSESSSDGLCATIRSRSSTMTMRPRKPMVCRRLMTVPGSIGL